MDNCFEFLVFDVTLGAFRGLLVRRICDRQKDVARVLSTLLLHHILDDTQDLFCTLYKLSAESLIRLSQASFVKKAVAEGVGDAADEAIAYEDEY